MPEQIPFYSWICKVKSPSYSKTWKNIFDQSAQANKTMRKTFTVPPFCIKFASDILYTSIINTFRKNMQIEM